MRAIRSILGLFIGLTVLAALGSALGAVVMKSRLTSHGEEPDEEISLVAIYSGRDFKSTARAFRSGSVLAWYGGGTVDLRGATLDPAGAVLKVRAIFGGFRLVVPETWKVERNVTAIFGGIGDARDEDAVVADGPTLMLDGFALFGGIGIVSEAPDLDLDKPIDLAPEASAPAPA